MYVQKENAKKLTKKQIKKGVLKAIEVFNKYNPKHKIKTDEGEVGGAVHSLYDLQNAILKGNSVWYEVEKAPRNLDSGAHYFTVWYCKYEKGKATKDILWVYDFIRAIGGVTQDRDRSIRKFIFKSSAIGMSRVLDATDGLFNFYKSLGGLYCQL